MITLPQARDPFPVVKRDVFRSLASSLPARRFCSWMNPRAVSLSVISSRSLHSSTLAGLDSYNAFNVVESLVNLARNYKRTVIFTIHQPRSNIVALFDQLVLLAMGKLVYSGPFANGRCFSYFEEKGWKCPEGFNMADFLSKMKFRP